MTTKKNHHLQEAHTIQGVILDKLDLNETDTIFLLDQLNKFGTHHKLAALADAARKLNGLYGFESHGVECSR